MVFIPDMAQPGMQPRGSMVVYRSLHCVFRLNSNRYVDNSMVSPGLLEIRGNVLCGSELKADNGAALGRDSDQVLCP